MVGVAALGVVQAKIILMSPSYCWSSRGGAPAGGVGSRPEGRRTVREVTVPEEHAGGWELFEVTPLGCATSFVVVLLRLVDLVRHP